MIRKILAAALLVHAAAALAQPPAGSDEAARLARIAALEAEGPSSFRAYLNALVELSTFYTNQARYADALPLLRRAHRASEEALGAQNLTTEQLRVTVLLMERFVPGQAAPQAAPEPSPASEAERAVGTGVVERAMNCVVFLGQAEGLSEQQRADYDDAAADWRAELVRETSAQEAAQLIGSNVNMLRDMPAATRRAAADYCYNYAPARETAPERPQRSGGRGD